MRKLEDLVDLTLPYRSAPTFGASHLQSGSFGGVPMMQSLEPWQLRGCHVGAGELRYPLSTRLTDY